MKKQKVIISCGGTGGHIFPGLEIAKSLQKQNPNLDILFVGASGRMEMDKVPKVGFKIIGIWIQGIYRKSIFKNILFPLKLIISLIQSLFILIKYKPLAVIGTGGFASFPIVYIASFLRIKTYIQEQNCYPGLANRLLGKCVKRVFVSHDGMDKFFLKNKILNLGNPVRKSLKIDSASNKESREFFGLKEDVFTILVVGGSLGAEPINRAISRTVKSVKYSIQFIWQTGQTDFSHYKHLNSNYCSVYKFIDRMDLAYHAADIVISRAGAIAISEICFLSKASILIPSPYVTANHQVINAEYLSTHNACIVCAENSLDIRFKDSLSTTDELIEAINNLKNKDKREKMGKNANQLFKYNSAEEIANIVLKETKQLC